MNATRKSTRMRTIPPWDCLRPRQSWAGMTTGTVSRFTRSPNAPTSPDCARGLSLVTPISSMRFYTYRTYHGGAMPLYVQRASNAAWSDETHVLDNRNLYREKFAAVLAILQPILDVSEPDASFYLWPRVPINDVDFARSLYLEQNLLVLPGRFLSRPVAGSDPGQTGCASP